jgi:tripartite-type tricarboxylate transporter receptor subunit TctC
MAHIPYRGAGPALTDLLGGRVDMMFATAAAAMPQIAGGKLRAIAVTTPQRAATLKNVPAIAETIPGYSVESWYGLFAPARTPAAVITKLNAAARKATDSAEFRKLIEPEGLAASGGAPAELDAFVRAETTRWARIIKENNVKID